jgi:hypothetical protein
MRMDVATPRFSRVLHFDPAFGDKCFDVLIFDNDLSAPTLPTDADVRQPTIRDELIGK